MAGIMGNVIYEVELNRPSRVFQLGNLYTGDQYEYRYEIHLTENGHPVDCSSVAVNVYAIRADGQTVVTTGTGNTKGFSVTLTGSMHQVVGSIAVAARLVLENVKHVLWAAEGTVQASTTDVMIDPGHVVPNIDDLLAMLDRMADASERAEAVAANVDGKISAAVGPVAARVNAVDDTVSVMRTGKAEATALAAEVERATSAERRLEDMFVAPVDEAVAEWLAAHPEATTTVQDRSITREKISAALMATLDRGVITPQMFGAVADGETDDTAAIQSALNALKPGGTLFLPKGGNAKRPSYKITSGLVLTVQDVTIISEARSEYSEGFVTDQPIVMLTIKTFGTKLQSVAFNSTNQLADGVVIDRRTPNDTNDSNSNLDVEFRDCAFGTMNHGVIGYGRNVFLFDNIFSWTLHPVTGVLHTYGGGQVSEFRGWRITGNRFHCSGRVQGTTDSDSATTVEGLSRWCVQMPAEVANKTYHLELCNNNIDLGGCGFYKGYLSGAKISGNYMQGYSTAIDNAMFVMSDVQTSNTGVYFPVIENNTVMSARACTASSAPLAVMWHNIVLKNVSNATIRGNVFRGAYRESILLDTCIRVDVCGNKFACNAAYANDKVVRPAVRMTNCSMPMLCDNRIMGQYGTNQYDCGFDCSSGCASIVAVGNAVSTLHADPATSVLMVVRLGGLNMLRYSDMYFKVPLSGYDTTKVSSADAYIESGMVFITVKAAGGFSGWANDIALGLPENLCPRKEVAFTRKVNAAADGAANAFAHVTNVGKLNMFFASAETAGSTFTASWPIRNV